MGLKNYLETLRSIIKQEYVYVGLVQSVNTAEGTSTVQTPAGGTAKVKGTSVQVGERALIQNGIIQSKAPSVAYYEFEVS